MIANFFVQSHLLLAAYAFLCFFWSKEYGKGSDNHIRYRWERDLGNILH